MPGASIYYYTPVRKMHGINSPTIRAVGKYSTSNRYPNPNIHAPRQPRNNNKMKYKVCYGIFHCLEAEDICFNLVKASLYNAHLSNDKNSVNIKRNTYTYKQDRKDKAQKV